MNHVFSSQSQLQRVLKKDNTMAAQSRSQHRNIQLLHPNASEMLPNENSKFTQGWHGGMYGQDTMSQKLGFNENSIDLDAKNYTSILRDIKKK